MSNNLHMVHVNNDIPKEEMIYNGVILSLFKTLLEILI